MLDKRLGHRATAGGVEGNWEKLSGINVIFGGKRSKCFLVLGSSADWNSTLFGFWRGEQSFKKNKYHEVKLKWIRQHAFYKSKTCWSKCLSTRTHDVNKPVSEWYNVYIIYHNNQRWKNYWQNRISGVLKAEFKRLDHISFFRCVFLQNFSAPCKNKKFIQSREG